MLSDKLEAEVQCAKFVVMERGPLTAAIKSAFFESQHRFQLEGFTSHSPHLSMRFGDLNGTTSQK